MGVRSSCRSLVFSLLPSLFLLPSRGIFHSDGFFFFPSPRHEFSRQYIRLRIIETATFFCELRPNIRVHENFFGRPSFIIWFLAYSLGSSNFHWKNYSLDVHYKKSNSVCSNEIEWDWLTNTIEQNFGLLYIYINFHSDIIIIIFYPILLIMLNGKLFYWNS